MASRISSSSSSLTLSPTFTSTSMIFPGIGASTSTLISHYLHQIFFSKSENLLLKSVLLLGWPLQTLYNFRADQPREHHVVLGADGTRILIHRVGKGHQVIPYSLKTHHFIDKSLLRAIEGA